MMKKYYGQSAGERVEYGDIPQIERIEEEELAKPKGKASILLIDDCDAKHASINRRWSFPNSSRREMFNR